MIIKTMDHNKYPKQLKKKSVAQLYFIIKDCKETLQAWPDHPNYGYYLDEIHYCAQELVKRQIKLVAAR